MNKKNILHLIKITIGLLIVGLSLYYCTKMLLVNWQEIKANNYSFSLGNLAWAFFFNILHLIMLSYSWQILTRYFKCELPAKIGMPIWLITYMGRYIPGKVLFVMGRVMAYNTYGTDLITTTYVTILDNFFHILTGTIIGAITLSFVPEIPVWCKLALIGAALTGSAIILNPYLCNLLLNKAIKKLAAKENPVAFEISFAKLLRISLNYLLAYIPLTISLYFLSKTFITIPFYQAIWITGCLASGVALGIMAIILPSGLGVREGVFAWLGTHFLPASMTAIFPIVARLMMTLTEITCAIGAILLLLIQKKSLKIFKVNQTQL